MNEKKTEEEIYEDAQIQRRNDWTTTSSVDAEDELHVLQEEVSRLRKDLAEEKAKNER